MTSNTTPIDLNAYKRFLDGEVEKHASDTKINNGTSIVNAVNVGSYSFSWGKIVEQLSGEFFIWKFQLSTLAKRTDGEKIYFQQTREGGMVLLWEHLFRHPLQQERWPYSGQNFLQQIRNG